MPAGDHRHGVVAEDKARLAGLGLTAGILRLAKDLNTLSDFYPSNVYGL
jgi:hypothetical protein